MIIVELKGRRANWNMAGLINFEDENEVKQFLDNLGVEYSFQCYKEKDPEGNNHVLTSGSLTTYQWWWRQKSVWSVWGVIASSCIPVTCLSLGCQRLADYLEGVKKNYESTAQVLKHNCETYGHGESCYKLGAYHITGKGKTAVDLICGLFLRQS